GIQPRTQEVFEDLGIIDRIVAAGGLYPPLRDYRTDGTFTDQPLGEVRPPSPGIPYFIPPMVAQFRTEEVMRERLGEYGRRVEYGCELTGFDQHAQGVTAWLDHAGAEQLVQARYLIGADGGRSSVRQRLGIDFPGTTLGVRAIVADVALQGLGRDAWHQFND